MLNKKPCVCCGRLCLGSHSGRPVCNHCFIGDDYQLWLIDNDPQYVVWLEHLWDDNPLYQNCPFCGHGEYIRPSRGPSWRCECGGYVRNIAYFEVL